MLSPSVQCETCGRSIVVVPFTEYPEGVAPQFVVWHEAQMRLEAECAADPACTRCVPTALHSSGGG